MVLLTEQKFLSFQLGEKDTAVIPLDDTTEVLPVSLGEICRLPQMPPWVLGIYNWRSEMLWLVELEERLGYKPTFIRSNFEPINMAIVVQIQGKYLGLIVRKLLDVELLDASEMNPPESSLFNPQIYRLIKGYFINDSEGMMIRLDVASIFNALGG
ncbi:chemotaxis protein CheW [Aetokthonos hydrillicola Thurmond2011]|jgi:positive phototaxis protein PixI|uniref:Chemotaxis protein CheW n=1 Tax=Aetokthonos hydrillicola Thurmond2011 TaxID=2712845 RepID=A0AAP5M8N8_9CYAN|nr:chemotaxis protein CheW [Aetokthonos hydrillicola]MBO3464175.1 chemotaxis protein CheW [Aetokthonos hydrillicola CCALA 1050]MBW4588119.1 chemotaxis protein CheW [Aetokthonos hydrillicola CCALA 1050]MDR9893434.1 chemotaxis protein CheW [Aetokthonos hydrillicola Thurmond2011]